MGVTASGALTLPSMTMCLAGRMSKAQARLRRRARSGLTLPAPGSTPSQVPVRRRDPAGLRSKCSLPATCEAHPRLRRTIAGRHIHPPTATRPSTMETHRNAALLPTVAMCPHRSASGLELALPGDLTAPVFQLTLLRRKPMAAQLLLFCPRVGLKSFPLTSVPGCTAAQGRQRMGNLSSLQWTTCQRTESGQKSVTHTDRRRTVSRGLRMLTVAT